MWKRRYREINDWERYLTDNGFRIVKLFLNLSKEEQRARFLRRIDLPDHNWKFSSADVREREHWDDYQRAFSEMLSHTSTEWAPWYVIPADRKWFARIGAGPVLVHALMEIDPRFPAVTKQQRQALLEVKQALEAQAPKGAAADPFEQERKRKGRRARRMVTGPPPAASARTAAVNRTVTMATAASRRIDQAATRGLVAPFPRGRRRASGRRSRRGAAPASRPRSCSIATGPTRCPRSSRYPVAAASSGSTGATCS